MKFLKKMQKAATELAQEVAKDAKEVAQAVKTDVKDIKKMVQDDFAAAKAEVTTKATEIKNKAAALETDDVANMAEKAGQAIGENLVKAAGIIVEGAKEAKKEAQTIIAEVQKEMAEANAEQEAPATTEAPTAEVEPQEIKPAVIFENENFIPDTEAATPAVETPKAETKPVATTTAEAPKAEEKAAKKGPARDAKGRFVSTKGDLTKEANKAAKKTTTKPAAQKPAAKKTKKPAAKKKTPAAKK